MKVVDAICTLGKMKARLEKNKPDWYANASDEEKICFDTYNDKKIEALQLAIDFLNSEQKLRHLEEMATKVKTYIGDIIDKYDNEVE